MEKTEAFRRGGARGGGAKVGSGLSVGGAGVVVVAVGKLLAHELELPSLLLKLTFRRCNMLLLSRGKRVERQRS